MATMKKPVKKAQNGVTREKVSTVSKLKPSKAIPFNHNNQFSLNTLNSPLPSSASILRKKAGAKNGKTMKKYDDGGNITMKDKTNTVVRDKDNSDVLMRDKNKSNNSVKTYSSEVNRNKDNSRIKSTTDNSVANIDKGKVKYKIAKGATVNFTAKNGRTMKKAQVGMVVPPKTTAKTPATTTPATTTNPRKGLTSNTQPVNAAGEVTTGMANPYKSKNGSRVMKKAKNGAKFPDLNKDGKVTRADILKGRGVIAKKGASVKKAMSSTMAKPMMKMGGTVKKAMNGYGGKAASMVPPKKAMMGAMTKPMMKSGGKMAKCKYGCN